MMDNDAARRVATVFEKWDCLIRTHLPEEPLKIDPLQAFRRGSLLEYGDFNPILPFLEGRSDAARRIVIPPSRLPPRRPYGFHNDSARLRGRPAWLGRALALLGASPTKGAIANLEN